MSRLTRIFCDVDDFCKSFEPAYRQKLLASGARTRNRQGRLCLSEVMTILIYFHQSRYRTFKDYYTRLVQRRLRRAFPHLVSYNRFVEIIPGALVPLCSYLHTRKGHCTGIAFIDSTPLAVCHNRRIRSHRVFRGIAKRGKTSVGWFFGFKLHLVVNERGELLAFRLTPGSVDDREPVPLLVKELTGKLFGDRGYISAALRDQLREHGLDLITRLKKNMKGGLMLVWDRLLLRKRVLVETVIDQLKNISQVEHTRHRSVAGFMVNVLAGLIAYTYQPKKPSLCLREEVSTILPMIVA
jgi:hypothetical protein